MLISEDISHVAVLAKKNLLHNMAYHVWTFLGFKLDGQGHGHIYMP